MPRSASKAKSKKPKPRSTIKETTPTGHEQDIENIIPGHLSLPQWNDMLIQEDTDEIVGEVMDELLGNVMDHCYKVYIERQLVPYAASWAEKYLTQTVEQQFFCLDEGDGPEELCRTEDFEPMPATPDSRAQGCVPVVQASNQPHCTSQELDDDQVPVQTEPNVIKEFNAFALKISSVNQAETETRPNTPSSDPPCVVPCPCPTAKTSKKEEQGNKQSPKKVPVKILPSLPSSVKKNNLDVKSNNIEDTALKEKATSLYSLKKRQPIPKLDPSCLPQRYIFPEYEIVDHTKPIPKRPGGLPRLELKLDKSPKPPISSKDQPKMFQKRSENDICLSKYEQEQRASSGPLRLDMKVLAKSISLLDSQAVKSSPVKSVYPSQSTKMMPIQSDVAVPMFSVDQVTAGPPPRVTPLIQSKNCDRTCCK